MKNIIQVYFPLMRPYMISGFLILYIDIAKELPATLILRPFNFDTLAIRIYELASNEMLYKVGFPSLILVFTTAIAVMLLNSGFGKRKNESNCTNKKSAESFSKREYLYCRKYKFRHKRR